MRAAKLADHHGHSWRWLADDVLTPATSLLREASLESSRQMTPFVLSEISSPDTAFFFTQPVPAPPVTASAATSMPVYSQHHPTPDYGHQIPTQLPVFIKQSPPASPTTPPLSPSKRALLEVPAVGTNSSHAGQQLGLPKTANHRGHECNPVSLAPRRAYMPKPRSTNSAGMNLCQGMASPVQAGGAPSPRYSAPPSPSSSGALSCSTGDEWIGAPGPNNSQSNSLSPLSQQQQSKARASLHAALVDAVSRNDGAAIVAAVEAGLSPNTSLPWRAPSEPDAGAVERSLLCLSAFYGSLEVARCLLAFGANPDFLSRDDGGTPLHAAAAGGSSCTANIIQLLLSHGANRDAVDRRGRRPVELLASHRQLQDKLAVEQQHAQLRHLKDMYVQAKMQEAAATVDQNFDEFDVIVGPHVPDPHGGENSDINKPEYSTDDFRINCFKVLKCTKTHAHDWTECPFVHPGEKARRRSPLKYIYTSAACPDFRKGVCRRGDLCGFSHGVFECWLHPSRYRTQMCKDGGHCTRRVCFFAHALSELRSPPPEPHSDVMSPSALDSPVAHSMPSPDICSPLSSPPGSVSELSQGLASNLNVANALMGLLPAASCRASTDTAPPRRRSEGGANHNFQLSPPSLRRLPSASKLRPPARSSSSATSPQQRYSPVAPKLQEQHMLYGNSIPPSLMQQQQLPSHAAYQQRMFHQQQQQQQQFNNGKGKGAAAVATSSSLAAQLSRMQVSELQQQSRMGLMVSGYSGHGSGGSGPVLKRCLTDNDKYERPGSEFYRAHELDVEPRALSAPGGNYNPPSMRQLPTAYLAQQQAQEGRVPAAVAHAPWLTSELASSQRPSGEGMPRMGSFSCLDVSWVDDLTGKTDLEPPAKFNSDM